ncbi:MAG: glycosyltransferase [Prevotella sp.]|jgi:glycosyltransferase involved in cell wall biosynthesis|nr:glycosyltransferase [Prevotella sp.]MCI1281400.1 glycosyltransferase [Prevotella sp.]
MKLSVIIPVYKVERTLKACVDSVLNQSYPDLEVVLVDDASPDNCSIICDEFARKDFRVKAIHLPLNRGLSVARNTGIEMSTAPYITFVDSDDTLEKDTYKKLMAILKNHEDYDMLEYSFIRQSPKRKFFEEHRFQDKEYTDMRAYWLTEKAYMHTYAWNKIYKIMLFADIKYPEKRKFEDVFTLPSVLQKCQKIRLTSEGLYLYNINENGITVTADGNALNDLFEAHMQILPKINDACYDAHVLNIAMDVYEGTGKFPEYPNLHHFRPFKQLLRQLLGFHTLCRLNKLLHRFHKPNRW